MRTLRGPLHAFRRRLHGAGEDQGVAMIIVLLVMVVLTGLGFAMTNIAVANLNNAGRDRLGGKALASAEGGIAQAISYLRTSGVNGLASSTWGSTAGHPVTVKPGVTYNVRIEAVAGQDLNIAAGRREGQYLIRSVGSAGAGPGKQVIEQLVKVRPFDFPLGIFTEQNLTASGQVPIFTESVLSRGCINDRDKLTFSGMDAAYRDALGNPVPAAAHSAGYITRSNSCNANPNSDNNRIHPNANPKFCAPEFPYDQDILGGRLDDAQSDPFCNTAANQYYDYVNPANPSAGTEKTSKFTMDKLERVFGYRSRGLSDAQYETLKNKAKASGTYFEPGGSSSTIQANGLGLPCYDTSTTPCASGGPKLKYPVVYIKAAANRVVTFQNGDMPGYTYPVSDSPCVDLPTLILVVEGANLQFSGNPGITGSIFVPDGNFDYQAGYVVGTVFAKTLQLTGNSNMRLTSCALQNVAGGLLTVTPVRYHQDDD